MSLRFESVDVSSGAHFKTGTFHRTHECHSRDLRLGRRGFVGGSKCNGVPRPSTPVPLDTEGNEDLNSETKGEDNLRNCASQMSVVKTDNFSKGGGWDDPHLLFLSSPHSFSVKTLSLVSVPSVCTST